MTKKELIEALKDYPDDMSVCVFDPHYSIYASIREIYKKSIDQCDSEGIIVCSEATNNGNKQIIGLRW